jgi:hypothetical protein
MTTLSHYMDSDCIKVRKQINDDLLQKLTGQDEQRKCGKFLDL